MSELDAVMRDIYPSGGVRLGCEALELQLQRELECARSALLIHGANFTLTSIEHFGDAAELSVSEVRIDIAEIWVIEKVESADAELGMQPVMDWEVSMQRNVNLKCGKSAGDISGGISRVGPLRHNKCRVGCSCSSVEGSSAGILRAIEIEWAARDEIHATVVSMAAELLLMHVAEERDGESAMSEHSSCNVPLIQQSPDASVGCDLSYVPGKCSLKVVANVLIGVGVSEWIERTGGAVIERVRPGVGGEGLDSMGEFSLEFDLERVVA